MARKATFFRSEADHPLMHVRTDEDEMLRTFIGIFAAILVTAMPAGAGVITVGGSSVDDQGQFSTVPGVTTVDFNALANGTQDFVAGIATYDDVNIFNCACSGTGDLLDDTTKGGRALRGGAFAIDFSQPISYFGLYWGSPDPENAISFFNGATPLFSFTGADLNAMFGVGFGVTSAAYVNFTASPGDTPVTRIVIHGVVDPFETDNHAFLLAVPEPASWLLFGSGAVAWMRRRRLSCRL
jgi:hypothetical protein